MERRNSNRNSMILENSLSEYQFRRTFFNSIKKHRELENRVQALQIERQKKLKTISRKLQSQKKQQSIQLSTSQWKDEMKSLNELGRKSEHDQNSKMKAYRQEIVDKIHSKQLDWKETKNKWFHLTKIAKNQNQRWIRQHTQNQITLKQEKIKRIRQMELTGQENIRNFWDRKVEAIQHTKKQKKSHCTQISNFHDKAYAQLKKKQNSLLKQIKQAQEIEYKMSSRLKLSTQQKQPCQQSIIYEHMPKSLRR